MGLTIETFISGGRRIFEFSGVTLVAETDFEFDYRDKDTIRGDIGPLILPPLGNLMLDLIAVPQVRVLLLDTNAGHQKVKAGFGDERLAGVPDLVNRLVGVVREHFPTAPLTGLKPPV